MPGYPQDTLKIVIGGNVGSDIWRTSLDMKVTLSGSALNAGSINHILSTSVAPLVNTWWTSIGATNSVGVDYSVLLGYFYPSGSTATTAVGTGGISASGGTGNAACLPFRTALVVSKHTNFAGRHNRGRMYVPFTNYGTLSLATGQTAGSVIGVYASKTADLIRALNTANWTTDGVSGQAAIVTSARAALTGLGITSVSCNTVPDSQRRRTNKDNPLQNSVSAI